MKGENIRRIRENKNYTQTELARLMKADRTYINRIENNKYTPATKFLEKLANALECNIKDFF